MPTPTTATVLPDDISADTLLHHALDVSLTGIQLLRPVYAPNDQTPVDFTFAYTNPAGLRISRVTEPLDGTLLERFPHARAAGVLAYYQQAFAAHEPLAYEANYQADGLDNYLRFQARRSGAYLLVSFTDTRDQPRWAVEEALRASQAREQVALAEAQQQQALLYRVFEQAPAMICILQGPTHVLEFVNPPYQALVGDRPLLGRPFAEAFPELAEQGLFEALDQLYRSGESFYAYERLAPIDHTNSNPLELEQRYYNFVWQARRDLAGAVDGVLVFAYEVTKQVQARQQVEQLNADLEARVQERTHALQEQQLLLSRILGQVPAAMATLSGPAHHYSFFNERYQELSAHRTTLGLTVAEVFPEVVAQGFTHLLDQVYHTGKPFVGTDMPAQLYDATLGQLRLYYVDFIYQPLFDEHHQVLGILAFILDVTEKALARQQVQDLNKELAAINQELAAINEELHASNTLLTRTNVDLDTFVYTASHDLKAPITNIESILLALRDTLPPAVQQETMVATLLAMLQQTVTRFQTTITQLTDITKLQLTHAEPAESVALTQVVEDVRLDLAPLIQAAAADLTVAVDPALRVSFSPANLRSVVYNLLSNALKYRAPDRPCRVQVGAEATAGAVVLTVQDNGLGLSAVQQRQLFGLFQRLHTHVEGTGVGLYITKRLIENGGGTITVHSQPGVGTTFTVTLPA